MNFAVIGKYTSKYGVILYCVKVRDEVDAMNIDMNNVYIKTFYFKGSADLKIGEVYTFQTIKGENGLEYCFLS